MAITLEQKLECLTEDEYDAIENIVDNILMGRRDKKSFSDGYLCEECRELTKPVDDCSTCRKNGHCGIAPPSDKETCQEWQAPAAAKPDEVKEWEKEAEEQFGGKIIEVKKPQADATPRPLCDACQYLPCDCDGTDGDYPDCYVDATPPESD